MTSRERMEALLNRFEKLPPKQQWIIFEFALQWVLDRLPKVQQYNPEQIPAADQDDIDAAFRALMTGFDL